MRSSRQHSGLPAFPVSGLRSARVLPLQDCALPARRAISGGNSGFILTRRSRAEIFGNIVTPRGTYLDAMALAVYHPTPKRRQKLLSAASRAYDNTIINYASPEVRRLKSQSC